MNQLKLSLRAADDPRTIKEENGVPTFASVFSLHNATRKREGGDPSHHGQGISRTGARCL